MAFVLHVVLYQPEIPPNTGNVIRLCANTGATLHLIEPLGFRMEDRELKRAGLDYHEWVDVRTHKNLEECLTYLDAPRLFAYSTRGSRMHTDVRFANNDALLFGPETRGLPQTLLDSLPAEQRLRLPLRPGNRSLNLSNCVAVAVFEAWRQLGFDGAA